MKRQISLKWIIILAFLSLGIILVVGFSLLSAQYFIRGMDNIMASNMEKAALSYINLVPADKREQLSSFSGYMISRTWEQMPESIRHEFRNAPDVSGVMLKTDSDDWLRPPDIIIFVMRYEHQGETLFIAHNVSAATSSKLVGQNVSKSMRTLVTISILSVLTLAIIIWLLLRSVSRPVAALGQWTRSLDPQKLNTPPPDFSYPELNELAELIRTSLSSVQQSLEREHRFLRHTSHELRTPINIIRNNIELIRKLHGSSGQTWDTQQEKVINRIDRASLAMKHVTEILLWLSRDVAEPPSEQKIHLDQMIQQLADEMSYLLNNKNVDVEVITHPCMVKLAEIPARIVLGNLIRNAFQHTWEGRVMIRQHQNQVEIVNSQNDGDSDNQSLGFGLGLQLITQLTTKLGWTYTNVAGPHEYRTMIELGTPLPD